MEKNLMVPDVIKSEFGQIYDDIKGRPVFIAKVEGEDLFYFRTDEDLDLGLPIVLGHSGKGIRRLDTDEAFRAFDLLVK